MSWAYAPLPVAAPLLVSVVLFADPAFPFVVGIVAIQRASRW